MSDIEIKKWECELLETSFWVIRVGKEFYFFGKEIAEALDYTNPKEAVHDHVDLEDKTSVEEVLGKNYMVVLSRIKSDGSKNLPSDFIQRVHRKQKLLTELGLISLCTKSRKKKARPFQRWVHKTIREIRETGSYNFPGGPVDNPLNLLDRVKTLEKELLESRQKKSFTSRGTQTQESSNKKSLKKLNSELEKSIKGLKNEIDRVESDLRKSIREINSSCSSSSYSSPSPLYSSDSD